MTDFLYAAPRKYPATFACMADAVAAHHKDGYITTHQDGAQRTMQRKPGDVIVLRHKTPSELAVRVVRVS